MATGAMGNFVAELEAATKAFDKIARFVAAM
jgi:hypothetical protein